MSAPAMPDLIIDRPGLQRRGQRTVFGLLTLGFWTLYLYLWLPLFTLGAWWLGAATGIEQLRRIPAPFVDTALFALLAKVAAIAFVLMIGWAEYNRRRFQGKERRGPRPAVTPEASTAVFGAAPEVGAALRRARHCTLVLDTDARAVAVEPLD